MHAGGSVRWSRVALFYGVACAGMSVVAAAIYALQATGLLSTSLMALAMFSPMCAMAVVHRADGRPMFDGLAVFAWSRWLLIAAGVAVMVSLTSMALGPWLPGVAWDWEMTTLFDRLGGALSEQEVTEARVAIEALPIHPVWLGIPQAVIAGATLNAVFAFGEEVGWRGWLHRELAPLGFWPSSLLTGVLWGFWHTPLILQGHNYPTQRSAGVFLFVVVCVLLSPLLAELRDRGQSVWVAAVFHGTFNATAGLAMLVVSGPELLVGVQGLAGVMTLAVFVVALLAWRFSRPEASRQCETL